MSTPYYQDELVTLFHGDCREITEWLAADVLVTDPPYGIGYFSERIRDANGRRMMGAAGRAANGVRGDRDATVRDAALTLWGARPALVFGTWRATRPADVKHRLVWDKNIMGMGDLRLPWGQCDEEIYVLGTWPPVKPGGRAREGGTPSRSSSVIRVQALAPGARARPDHPTPKPVPLMVQLIEKCPPGVIADPFAGSGATLLAARQVDRHAIGVEVEERYCELIAGRLAEATPQTLFDLLDGEAS